MLALAYPIFDAAGQPAGFAWNSRVGARLLQRRQPRGELLREVDFDLLDVRLGAQRDRHGQLRGEARTIGFARLRGRRDRELRLEREFLAIGALKRRGHRRLLTIIARHRAQHRPRFAARRIQREPGAVDADADVPDVRDDPVDDRRNRFATRRVDRDLRRVGVDLQAETDHDRAEIERAHDSRGDAHDRERIAVEGPGEVQDPGDVIKDGPDSGADKRVPDLTRRGTRGFALLLHTGLFRARWMSASGQNGTPERFAVKPTGRTVE